MNRPTIKKILNDATLSESEKIDQIFAVYTASTSKLKTEEDLQKAVENAQKGLNVKETEPYKELEKKLTELETAHKETLKAKETEITELKTGYETEKTTAAKQSILRKQLTADGANPKLIGLLEKEFDIAKIEVDGDKIKDWDNLSKPVKEQYADVFGKTTVEGANPANPPAGTGGVLNPFAQEHFNLQAQTDLFRKDPNLARQMAASVGVKLL